MMKKKRTFARAFLAFATTIFSVAPLANLHAQKTKEKEAGIEFSCYLWNGPFEEDLYYLDGEEYRSIEVFSSTRSKPHRLKISQDLQLFVKRVNPEDEALAYRLVGRSPLLGSTEKILFLLFQLKDLEGLPFKIRAFDDSLAGFPAGSFRFVNFSKAELRVKLGDSTKKISANGETIVSSKVDSGGGLVPFLIGDQSGRMLYQSRLFAQDTGREIIFISPPLKEKGLPEVRFLSQLMPRKIPATSTP